MKSINRTFFAGAVVIAALGLLYAAPVQAFSVTVNLRDSANNGLAGGTVKWNTGSWHTVPGSTAADGTLTFDIPDGTLYNTIVVTYHQISQAKSRVEVEAAGNNPAYQTIDAGIKLIDSQGNGLAGGVAKQGEGSWVTIGTTGADGTVAWEVFPGGPYQYQMTYNNGSQSGKYAVPGVVFQTGKLDILNSETVRSNKGGSWWTVPKPTELLPGDYPLYFSGVLEATVTIAAGDSITAALLRLKDVGGAGVEGGKATPATGGSWNATVPGETNTSGKLFAELPSGFTKIRMTVNQTSQEKSRAQLDADNYTWQTATATINVLDSTGAGLAGVQIDQGGGFWDNNKATTDASGTVTIPMFPGSAKFRASHNKTSQTITQAVPSTFVFQTGQVHSDSVTCVKWATGSWNAFVQDMEVFPGTYRFVFSDGTPTTPYAISAATVNSIH